MAAALPPEPAYVWNVEEPGEAVAHGVPDTDDRDLRIICSKHGRRWVISGPIDAEIGKSVTMKVIGAGSARAFKSRVGYDGNGANFTLPVTPTDDAVRTLMTGKPLWFELRSYRWAVTGAGAAKALGPLLRHCTAR